MVILATSGIVHNLHEILKIFGKYISSYVHFLNKFIGHLRRVASLRFERTTLIKYVKKLRFFHDALVAYDIYADVKTEGETPLVDAIMPMASFYLKLLELLDLLNFYLTQPLQKEILSKTLNPDLNLSEDCVAAIEDTCNHFVKFTEWMVESIEIESPFLQLEVVQFARKCAIEDNVDLDDTNDIFLQEVVPVQDSKEYDELSKEWSLLLEKKMESLDIQFNTTVAGWNDKFEKKKESS